MDGGPRTSLYVELTQGRRLGLDLWASSSDGAFIASGWLEAGEGPSPRISLLSPDGLPIPHDEIDFVFPRDAALGERSRKGFAVTIPKTRDRPSHLRLDWINGVHDIELPPPTSFEAVRDFVDTQSWLASLTVFKAIASLRLDRPATVDAATRDGLTAWLRRIPRTIESKFALTAQMEASVVALESGEVFIGITGDIPDLSAEIFVCNPSHASHCYPVWTHLKSFRLADNMFCAYANLAALEHREHLSMLMPLSIVARFSGGGYEWWLQHQAIPAPVGVGLHRFLKSVEIEAERVSLLEFRAAQILRDMDRTHDFALDASRGSVARIIAGIHSRSDLLLAASHIGSANIAGGGDPLLVGRLFDFRGEEPYRELLNKVCPNVWVTCYNLHSVLSLGRFGAAGTYTHVHEPTQFLVVSPNAFDRGRRLPFLSFATEMGRRRFFEALQSKRPARGLSAFVTGVDEVAMHSGIELGAVMAAADRHLIAQMNIGEMWS